MEEEEKEKRRRRRRRRRRGEEAEGGGEAVKSARRGRRRRPASMVRKGFAGEYASVARSLWHRVCGTESVGVSLWEAALRDCNPWMPAVHKQVFSFEQIRTYL